MYRAYEAAIQYVQARERTGRKRGNGRCAGEGGGCAHERRRSTAKRRQAESMATGDRLRCAQSAPPRQSRQEVPGVSCPGASCSAEPSRCLGVAAAAACPRRKRLDYGDCHLTHMGETALQVGTIMCRTRRPAPLPCQITTRRHPSRAPGRGPTPMGRTPRERRTRGGRH